MSASKNSAVEKQPPASAETLADKRLRGAGLSRGEARSGGEWRTFWIF